jgi:hypothetical protein
VQSIQRDLGLTPVLITRRPLVQIHPPQASYKDLLISVGSLRRIALLFAAIDAPKRSG